MGDERIIAKHKIGSKRAYKKGFYQGWDRGLSSMDACRQEATRQQTKQKKYITEIIADFAAAQVDSVTKPKGGLDGMGSAVDDQEIPF